MTVALAGRVPATFEIKSANLPLVALLLKSADLGLLERELQERFGEIPDFFDNDPLVIDLGPLGEADVDFRTLIELLRQYRMVPVAVKGASEAQRAAALQVGLAVADDAALTPALSPMGRDEEAPAAGAPTPALPQGGTEKEGPALSRGGSEKEGAVPSAPSAALAEVARKPATSALIIDRPLRSGQQVYARGRDVVVLAMVNPGAEIIADGHVHVYAPLRGKAIAGARGDVNARILTLCLEPELVSIAGVYRTSENPLPTELRGKPAQIRLEGDKLVMEPLHP